MPARRAAIGSFHVKSPTTYFVMVLMTVRVLPFVLTVVLIRSVTLFVSTLGVRSYSDQRYASMQISTTRHSSRISTRGATGCTYSVPGPDVNRDTSRTRVSGGGGGRESGKGASTTGASAAETPAGTKAVSRGAGSIVAASSPRETAASATGGVGKVRSDVAKATEAIAGASGAPAAPRSALEVVAARVASRFRIGVAVFSTPDHPKPPGQGAHQTARATVPHNSTSASCRS